MPTQRPGIRAICKTETLSRYVLFVVCFLTVLQAVPMGWAQSWPPIWPPSPHTPLIDSEFDDVVNHTYYKNRYHGFLYGHYNEGFTTPQDNGRHVADGLDFATNRIAPICNQWGCKIVVLGIGFSNWTKELCGDQTTANGTNIQDLSNPVCSSNAWSFIAKSPAIPLVNPNVAFVDCAILGAVAVYWAQDQAFPGPLQYSQTGNLYENCNGILSALHLTNDQVQVVLFKDADSGEPPNVLKELPDSSHPFNGCTSVNDADACQLMYYVAKIARNIKTPQLPGDQTARYPNTKIMMVHSRIYGGYANAYNDPNDPTHFQQLNPEPLAYEQGFAMKWLIQAQVDEMKGSLPGYLGSLNYKTGCGSGGTKPCAPWIDWGAYLWASGTDIPCIGCGMALPGLTWRQDYRGPDRCDNHPENPQAECDFQATSGSPQFLHPDNTHPSRCARDKVSNLLIYNYCKSPYVRPWLTPGQNFCTMEQPINNCAFPQ